MAMQETYDWEQQFYNIWKAIESMKANKERITVLGISRAVNIPGSTITSACKRIHALDGLGDIIDKLGACIESEQVHEQREAALTFVDKKTKDIPDWREFAELAKETQHFGERIDDSQRVAHIKIETDTPIAVMGSGDWHLGGQGVDYTAWVEDIEYLLSTPSLYMIEVGDDRQNMRNFRNLAGVLNQVLSPKQQAHMMRGVVEELTAHDKLLAKVGGNHDEEFDQRIFGEALQGYLLEKMKAPRFKNRGLIYLTVGEVEYTILAFHKSRFKSFLRRTHGAMREHQLSFPADLVIGGHDHTPGMEHLHHYTLAEQAGEVFGGETIFIKVGTYQDSEYGWRYFHNGGFAANYTVVFHPNEKHMEPFTSPRAAMRYVNSFE